MNRTPHPTLWLNATISAHWSKTTVGIVRTEIEIFKALVSHLQGWDIRFIVFTKNAVQTCSGKTYGDHHDPIPFKRFNKGDILLEVGLDLAGQYTPIYPILRNNGLKIISMCYDLIPILYPQYTSQAAAKHFARYLGHITSGSDHVLCISACTQSDYLKHCHAHGWVAPPTSVLTLGDHIPSHGPMDHPELHKVLAVPYILFVSTIERRKNHETLYRAYHLLCQQGHREQLPLLVFAGKIGWGVAELIQDMGLDPQTQGKILVLNQVSDNDLTALYQHALFTVYPSLYEGWGLPVAESLLHGKWVISSNRASLPEVGGRYPLYLDPWDVNAWAEALLKFSSQPELVHVKEAEIRHHYSTNTWGGTAESVVDVIEKLIHHSS